LGSPLFPNLGDAAGAREFYAKALAIARDLAKADRNDQLAQYDLANALLFRSVLDLPKEEWAGSLADLEESEGILQKLAAADPRSINKMRTLALVQEYEGRRLDKMGRIDDAVAKMRQSLATTEQVLAHNPSDLGLLSQELASEEDLAEALAHQGDRPGALELERHALAHAQQLRVPDSERERITRSVAVAHQSLAEVEATFGNWREARAAAQSALEGWRQLVAAGSHRIDPGRVARDEALLKDCDAHLRQ
jgi:tetratricopeptide (TPR) repeat protein